MLKNPSLPFALVLLSATSAASAQIDSATVDMLNIGDPGGPTPFGVVVLDFSVDVAPTDTWTSAGISCFTSGGATLIYADGEPDEPGTQPNLINTGSLENRFVTMLSRPRTRNAAGRFDNGAVAITGAYDPPASTPINDPTYLNVSFTADPPAASDSPSVDGYVIRIALSTPGFSADSGALFISTDPNPPGAGVLLASIAAVPGGSSAPGWVNSTFDVGTPTGGDFYLWAAIPEPDSLALILFTAALLRRRIAWLSPTPQSFAK